MKKIAIILMIMLLACSGCVSKTSEPQLADGFQTPPDSAKPWTFWWWLDSNVSKAGIAVISFDFS